MRLIPAFCLSVIIWTSGAKACESLKQHTEIAKAHGLIVVELDKTGVDSAIQYVKNTTGKVVEADRGAIVVGPKNSILILSVGDCVIGWMTIQRSQGA